MVELLVYIAVLVVGVSWCLGRLIRWCDGQVELTDYDTDQCHLDGDDMPHKSHSHFFKSFR